MARGLHSPIALDRILTGEERAREAPPAGAVLRFPRRRGVQAPFVRAAARLNRASGLLALSVLLDSAVEHYRGAFKNPAMATPLIASTLSLLVSAHGSGDGRGRRHGVRNGVYALAALTGLVGTGFHLFNVLKRPNGIAWQNLFYGAPLGAPGAILLSGLLGVYSEEVREAHTLDPKAFGLPAGRGLAGLTAFGLLATAGEAGLLHFRGAFQNPAMLAPVTLPPAGALLLARAAGSRRRDLPGTAGFMRLLALMGLLGVGFHAYGVQRSMGGWRNWTQNVLDGPPLPAPPSFTGLALAGLAALGLLRDHPDA